jgi:hypothetical protein
MDPLHFNISPSHAYPLFLLFPLFATPLSEFLTDVIVSGMITALFAPYISMRQWLLLLIA